MSRSNRCLERREATSDEQYFESCATFVQTLQETILKCQQTVMTELGLSPEIMERTMMSYMMEGNMQVIEQVQSTSANLQYEFMMYCFTNKNIADPPSPPPKMLIKQLSRKFLRLTWTTFLNMPQNFRNPLVEW